LIARNLWSVSAYYEIMWDIDKVILQAHKVLLDDQYFRKIKIG
jgi:hypothetical protein